MCMLQDLALRLRRFMEGRNGLDALCGVWFVLYMLANLALRFVRVWWLIVLQFVFLGLLLGRALSRNVDKRREENLRFLERWSAFRLRLSGAAAPADCAQYRRAQKQAERQNHREEKARKKAQKKAAASSGPESGGAARAESGAKAAQAADSRIFSCPDCGQQLRVPAGKGKILITCKKCGREFSAQS